MTASMMALVNHPTAMRTASCARLGTNEKSSEEAVHRYLEAADDSVDFGPACCSSRVVARADRALTLPKPFEMRSFGPPVPTVGPSSGTTAFPP
jgi:hypothetical protein